MNRKIRKILFGASIIIGLGVLGYIGFVGYVVDSMVSGYGMDDGPFEAVLTDDILVSDSVQILNLDSVNISDLR